MNEVQKNRINDYIRWGLTQQQAEAWVLEGIYPVDIDTMKHVRRNRWREKALMKAVSLPSKESK